VITSIEDPYNNFSESAHIFPNPASDVLHIEGISTDAEIAIYNSNGSRVNFTRTGKSIDVSDFPTGIYFIEIRSEGKDNILKFVKN
jgi:hypothetical protein